MTVKEIWRATTCDLYLHTGDGGIVKLPSGGRCPEKYAEIEVRKMEPRAFASAAPVIVLYEEKV